MGQNTIKLFSSKKSDNWQTPKDLLLKLYEEFSINFDPCPLHPLSDGLKIKWGKRCFVNPSYSKVSEFLEKAHEEIEKGNTELAVFLTFANTDTAWFHEHLYHKAEIRFIRGRLKFLDEKGQIQNSAMRPSMICILRPDKSEG